MSWHYAITMALMPLHYIISTYYVIFLKYCHYIILYITLYQYIMSFLKYNVVGGFRGLEGGVLNFANVVLLGV